MRRPPSGRLTCARWDLKQQALRAAELEPAVEHRHQASPRAWRYPRLRVRSPATAPGIPAAGVQVDGTSRWSMETIPFT